MFLPLLRRVALVCCLPLAAPAANSLVSLQTTTLAPAAVTSDPLRPTFNLGGKPFNVGVDLEGQKLPGLDPALTPLTAAEQDGAVFVLARDAAGQAVLLRHDDKTGWERRASPPYPLLRAAQAISQAHIFFVSPDAAVSQLRLVAYHTITNTWAVLGTWPLVGTVEHVLPSHNGFVVTTRDASGQVHATQAELISSKRGLKFVDYAVIVAYLCVVAGIGLYFYVTGKKDPANFFVAGRKIPWWAAGLSLYATGTSAISYLAIPAKSYATNWLYLAQNVVTFAGTIYVGFVIVPLIRRLNLISVYQYLEMRFHPTVRMMASLICIVQHLGGRMSIVLLLPALALSAVTGHLACRHHRPRHGPDHDPLHIPRRHEGRHLDRRAAGVRHGGRRTVRHGLDDPWRGWVRQRSRTSRSPTARRTCSISASISPFRMSGPTCCCCSSACSRGRRTRS